MTGLGKELADAAGYGSVGDTGTIELDNGKSLRVRLEPDYDTSITDFPDLWGTIEEVQTWDRDGCRAERPSHFNGNAEKVWIDRDRYWWQPPSDVKRTDPSFAEFRRLFLETAEFGYMVVVVELLEGEDYHGNGIIRNSTSLGGVESMADKEYIASIIEDMLFELDDQMEMA